MDAINFESSVDLSRGALGLLNEESIRVNYSRQSDGSYMRVMCYYSASRRQRLINIERIENLSDGQDV